ncbi:hypothetical protein GNIT_0464 [Glaciecola nitratireducens FR1064]|uniref:Uncharacterized protein n=1 Tax=Glaciecola nitratireducens (strain JCM 12485 / KCTC 12276 / FR1064) TaxID=1085623 RepID=G4QFJ3_GLANF|nr:hypothetical protein GNIT_0464 [Glaciecola nitratireducens FR1064]
MDGWIAINVKYRPNVRKTQADTDVNTVAFLDALAFSLVFILNLTLFTVSSL